MNTARGPIEVPLKDAEVTAGLDYLGRFLEQFNEYQVVALTFPMEEIELFFAQLEKFLTLIKTKTGFLFAPIILQKSLFCPMDEFMVVLHKISMIDIKLPRISQFQNVSQLAGAFKL